MWCVSWDEDSTKKNGSKVLCNMFPMSMGISTLSVCMLFLILMDWIFFWGTAWNRHWQEIQEFTSGLVMTLGWKTPSIFINEACLDWLLKSVHPVKTKPFILCRPCLITRSRCSFFCDRLCFGRFPVDLWRLWKKTTLWHGWIETHEGFQH